MHRTQLYLDDDLWNALRAWAKSQRTTISELVREVARERYLGKRDQQREAMQQFVGSGKGRSGSFDAVEYVRGLRRSSRLNRLRSE